MEIHKNNNNQEVDRELLMKLIREFEHDLEPTTHKLNALRLSVLHEAGRNNLSSRFNQKERLEDQFVKIVNTYIQLAGQYSGRFVQHNNDLYVYNGAFWEKLQKEVMMLYMSEIAEGLGMKPEKAHYFENNQKLFKQLLYHSPLPPVNGMGTTYINLANGTLAIDDKGSRLLPHSEERFLTYALKFPYDAKASCPVFNQFLDEVLPNKALQMILAEYLGYVFVPNSQLKLEKILILLGSGANGKSVFFQVVNALLGKENISNYSISSLVEGPMAGQYRVGLADKLLNYSSELDSFTNHALFKQIISGEPLEAKYLYQNPFIMTDYARLMVNANELPKIPEHTDAWYRRLLIIPFEVTIPLGEQDPKLAKTIINNELPGVLNWVIAGLGRLLRYDSFTQSDIIDEHLSNYRVTTNSVLFFMTESEYEPDPQGNLLATRLFNHYKEFCADYALRSVGYNNFIKTLETSGWVSFRSRNGKSFRCRNPHQMTSIKPPSAK